MKKPVTLIILDGWGYSEKKEGNAVMAANTPNFERYQKEYPNTLIQASGEAVGLPDGQMGNSEVGHLNIGAGRVVYQPLMRITKSIKDGEFADLAPMQKLVDNCKAKDSALHLIGLVSDGGVHSHLNHIKGTLDFAKAKGLTKVYIHVLLDGRDTPPQSGRGYVKELKDYMDDIGIGEVATVAGRYYTMDRDNRWERIELGYNAMVCGKGVMKTSADVAIADSYSENVNDEFVVPTVITKDARPVAKIQSGDSVFFFNFRPDRARQITRALTQPEFDGFAREDLNLEYVTMTVYDSTFVGLTPVFTSEKIEDTFGEYIADKGLNQLRIAETEKYAHVTFFFNGGVEEPYKNEDRILVSSPKVATYDLQPEMSSGKLTEKLVDAVNSGKYDAIIANFANPDMVGHTGIMEAAVKAIEAVDTAFGKVVDAVVAQGGTALVTADHGNSEQMIDPETGKPHTAHTTNPVPLLVIGAGDVKLRDDGKLSDLAPTMLNLMGVEKPELMTGRSIIK